MPDTTNYAWSKPAAGDLVTAFQASISTTLDSIDSTVFSLVAKNRTTKTANYSASAGEMVDVDATGGAVTITVPNTAKAMVFVGKTDSSTNPVIVSATGGVNGDSTYEITQQWGGVVTIGTGSLARIWGEHQGGAVTSVDGQTGVVDLSSLYVSQLNGASVPYVPSSIGAATFTPDLTVGYRFEVTTTGNPTVAMPTVSSGSKRSFELRLINDGTGGYGDPTWDAKVTWVGLKSTRQQGASTWDLYYFETVDNTVWWGYHLTALFSVGAAYVDFTKMTAPATPGSNVVRQYVDTADTVMKVKDQNGEVHLQEIHVATTAPTNTAIPWLDTN
jgi:hypothetical protein